MPRKRSISKRQRPIPVKSYQPAVLEQIEFDVKKVVSVGVTIGERELKLARALADTEERVRSASLTSLRTWLEIHASQLDSVHLDQLWKALFYCIWMTDKRHRISVVIRDVLALEDILGIAHIRALFRCLSREWLGIDKHRVDKFYELTNVALESCVHRVIDVDNDAKLRLKVDEFLACIDDELTSKINRGGKGILMHILDKWVDVVLNPVLEKAVSFSRNSVHWTWDRLLDPFLALLKLPDGRLDAVKVRFEERVLCGLINIATSESLQVDKRTRHDMLNRVSKALFAAASEPRISDDCRKRLYNGRTELMVAISGLKETVENNDLE